MTAGFARRLTSVLTADKLGTAMRLADYLARHNLSDEAFAERVGDGCSVSTISKLRRQHMRPSLDRAWRIEVASKGAVTLADWQYEPRRPGVETSATP